MREDDRDRVSRLGTEAWKRLKKTKDYNDWVKVGEALQVGREWAMNQAGGINKPEGKAYNFAFGEWLQRYKLDDMDKGDRSRLFQMMDALPLIEEWRRTLTLTERLKLNHPNAVLRKFKAKCEVPDPAKPKQPGLRESVAALSEENMQLKAEIARLKLHIEEVEASREVAVAKKKGRAAKAFADPVKQVGAFHNEVVSWVGDYCTRVENWFVAQPDITDEGRSCIVQASELMSMRLQNLAQSIDGRASIAEDRV